MEARPMNSTFSYGRKEAKVSEHANPVFLSLICCSVRPVASEVRAAPARVREGPKVSSSLPSFWSLSGCIAWIGVHYDDIFKWDCAIRGPSDSLWEGGLCKIRVELPENYPAAPTISLVGQVQLIHHCSTRTFSRTGKSVCQSCSPMGGILRWELDRFANAADPASQKASQAFKRNKISYEFVARKMANDIRILPDQFDLHS
ncbi:ubiquitin--protein ligase [Trichuris suis]|nr:ubiquitin--protein ligase [Trichuris suis]